MRERIAVSEAALARRARSPRQADVPYTRLRVCARVPCVCCVSCARVRVLARSRRSGERMGVRMSEREAVCGRARPPAVRAGV